MTTSTATNRTEPDRAWASNAATTAGRTIGRGGMRAIMYREFLLLTRNRT